MMKRRFELNDTVLFQGDSITDCGRDRNNPQHLGGGYANLIAAWFGAKNPERRVSFVNRGVSGNRARDLEARWDDDCLEIRPTWVSLLIGINDVWRRFDANSITSAEVFEASCRNLVAQVRDRLDARIVILEPFLLPVTEDQQTKWREDLDPKIAAVRRVAQEYADVYVPLDGIFAAACVKREPAFWAADGVHPTAEGHALIAQSWLSAVKSLD